MTIIAESMWQSGQLYMDALHALAHVCMQVVSQLQLLCLGSHNNIEPVLKLCFLQSPESSLLLHLFVNPGHHSCCLEGQIKDLLLAIIEWSVLSADALRYADVS